MPAASLFLSCLLPSKPFHPLTRTQLNPNAKSKSSSPFHVLNLRQKTHIIANTLIVWWASITVTSSVHSCEIGHYNKFCIGFKSSYTFYYIQWKTFIYIPQEKIIVEFIKMTQFKIRLILNLNQYLLCIWTLTTMTVWFWDLSFCTDKGFKQSLMLQKEKQCIKSLGCKLLNRMKST